MRALVANAPMRALVGACLLGVCCSASLSSAGLLNAHQYLENLEEKRGRRMTHAEVKKDFRKLIDKLYASGNDPKEHPHREAIAIVRSMATFYETVINAHAQMTKDEL